MEAQLQESAAENFFCQRGSYGGIAAPDVDALTRARDGSVEEFARCEGTFLRRQDDDELIELAALRPMNRQRPCRTAIGQLAQCDPARDIVSRSRGKECGSHTIDIHHDADGAVGKATLGPEQRRREIQRIARSLGYRPDPLIAKLMARLHSRRRRNDPNHIAWIDLWPGAKEAARAPGFPRVFPRL